MISIAYSTRQFDSSFYEHIKEQSTFDNQIIYKENQGEFGLTELYNTFLSDSDNEIMVIIHDDVILPKGFDEMILNYFVNYPDYGIMGIAGTTHLDKNGVWFNNRHLMVGQLYHMVNNEPRLTNYSAKKEEVREALIVDGVILAINTSKIKREFNEEIKGFHYYDVSFCIDNFNEGVKIGVFHLPQFIHKSMGMVGDSFIEAQTTFTQLYKNIIPLKVDIIPQFKHFNREIKTKNKIAVIIPTKNNYEELKSCIDSFQALTNPNIDYQIYVADTGSDSETKEQYKKLTSVKIVYFDYYHFAKINNAMVKSHINKEKHLVFCNDDIELKNDVLSEFLYVYSNNNKVGTIGARLYHENNRIQHAGVKIRKVKDMFQISHIGYNSVHNYSSDNIQVAANTAALMMIDRTLFNKIGKFNENTVECFEDLLINLTAILSGYKNIFTPNAVAIHKESVSRRRNPQKQQREEYDYKQLVLPFLRHYEKHLKKFIDG